MDFHYAKSIWKISFGVKSIRYNYNNGGGDGGDDGGGNNTKKVKMSSFNYTIERGFNINK